MRQPITAPALCAVLAAFTLCVGCGTPSHVRVETGARAIEQPTVGQSLIAAAPIPKHTDPHDYGVRLALGGGGGLGGASTLKGRDGAVVHANAPSLGGLFTLNLGEVELGVTLRGGVAPQINSQSGAEGLHQGGLRLRVSPGNDQVRINLSGEVGGRLIEVVQGDSLLCDVARAEVGDGWGPVDGGRCWRSSGRRGTPDWNVIPYATASVYPAAQVADRLWVYVGVGVDAVVRRYESREVWTLYEGGLTYRSTADTGYSKETAFTWLAGADWRLNDTLGLLVNVRGGGLGDDLGAPSVEGALNLMF